MSPATTLHRLLDWQFGADGCNALRQMLADGADVNGREGPLSETPLHVATRRRRAVAAEILLEHGAEIDAVTAGGKTAYAHAVRRGFSDLAELLLARDASDALNDADRFAVAVINGWLDEARSLAASRCYVVHTGNPEEDRLLADVAGRRETEPVATLIELGANLRATGLDDGTPLHQAAWFGQPANARLLLDAGAPVDAFDSVHESSPLGWAVHGSRYSGGADQRQHLYVELVHMLLEAGASLHDPDHPDSDAYYQRLLADATPEVADLLRLAR